MVTELTNAGYESIRDLVNSSRSSPSQWDFIALIDDGDSEVTRVSITGDSRAQWIVEDRDTDSTNETMVVEFTVTGSDSDISTPVTLAESRIYDTSSGGNSLSEDTFSNITLSADEDEMTLVHAVEIPQVP